MKPITLRLLLAATLLSGFSACKKDEPAPADTQAPVITVTGGNSVNQSLPAVSGTATFTPPAATAMDNVNGDLSANITVSGNVDPNLKGTYIITYSVTDGSGNQASTDVTVHIVNDAEFLAGNYSVHDSVPAMQVYNYSQTVVTDNFMNNKIRFIHTDGFAYYLFNENIYAFVNGSTVGSTVSLPYQLANNIGSLSEDHDFTGSGTLLSLSPAKFNIGYNDHNISQNVTFANCLMTLTHN